MNSHCSINTQILLNIALDDQKRSGDRKLHNIRSHQYDEQHGHTMTRNNLKYSILGTSMMFLNTVLVDDQNDHEKLSNETIDENKNKTYQPATVRSILDNLSRDSFLVN